MGGRADGKADGVTEDTDTDTGTAVGVGVWVLVLLGWFGAGKVVVVTS